MDRIKNAVFYVGVRIHMALDTALVFIEQKVKEFRAK
jgi:hypothetical protein